MIRSHAQSTTRGRGGSIIAALVFNASLLMLPFAGASLYQSLSAPDLIDYTPTPSSIRATQDALRTEVARFAPTGAAARKETWNNLIARELAEDDIAAARGFALSAYTLLGGADAATVRRAVKPGSGDTGLLDAAVSMVDPYMRQRYRAVIAPIDARGFDVLGDARETAALAQRWLGGESIDLFLFTLAGVTLPGADAPQSDVRLGASVVKIAKNGARLTPEFASLLERRLAAAAPAGRLRAELAATFQNRDAIVDDGAAAALAFSRAIDRDAYAALATDLAHIGAAARAASPAGAAQLLAHVRDPRDLRRLELLAVATGERSVAVAKRTPTGLVLRSARGAVRWSDRLVGDIASVALATLGLVIATHLAMMAALRGAWEGRTGPPPAPATPISKADAQRRARAERLESV